LKPYHSTKHILLIDQQPFWREVSFQALRSAGFLISILDTYNYLPSRDFLNEDNPDLVVLGCVQIGPEEQRLISQLLALKQHLLVVSASLSWQMMRTLFLQGVDDIVNKPDEPASLVKIVNQTIESTVPHNSYQAVERYGVG